MRLRWLWVTLGTSGDEAVERFWAQATATTPAQGVMRPADGDPWLRLLTPATDLPQLTLDVDDVAAAVEETTGIGATRLGTDQGGAVLRSPGGFVFAITDWAAAGECTHQVPADPMPDQLCLDVPAPAFDRELDFWRSLTGWQTTGFDGAPEFVRLSADQSPVRLLLQRLGETSGPVRSHLDIGCLDLAAGTQRHRRLGAELVDDTCPWWTVLRAPDGQVYCLVDRSS